MTSKLLSTKTILLLISFVLFYPSIAQQEVHSLPEPPSTLELANGLKVKVFHSDSNYVEILDEPREEESIVLDVNRGRVSIRREGKVEFKVNKKSSIKKIRIHIFTTDPTKLKRIDVQALTSLTIEPKLDLDHDFRLDVEGISNVDLSLSAPSVVYNCNGISTISSAIETNSFIMELAGMSKANLSVQSHITKIEVVGMSKGEIALVSSQTHLDVEGMSSLALSGKTDSLTSECAGFSSINASKFKVNNATVEAAGFSKTNVNVIGYLKRNANGFSRIKNRNK